MSATRLVAAALLLSLAAPIGADEAEDAFSAIYGNDYKRVTASPDRKDDVALAADLLKAARVQGVQPGLLAILCSKAYELGTKLPAGYDTAVQAMELLAQKSGDNAADALGKAALIRGKEYAAAKGADKADAGEIFIEAVLVSAEAHLAGGSATEAMALLRKAATAAKAIKSQRASEIQGRIDRAAARQRVEKQVADLQAKVEADPQDAASRKQLIRLALVELDKPALAEEFLAESTDADLRKYVPSISKGVEAAPEVACMELGEWYRGLGEAPGVSPFGKEAMLRRARAYYQRFLDLHKAEDLQRNQASLALKKADEALAKLGPAKGAGIIGPGRWIDLVRIIDPEKDCAKAKDVCTKTEEGLAILKGGWNPITIPIVPAGSYELTLSFTRQIGNYDIFVLFPAGSGQTSFLIGTNYDELIYPEVKMLPGSASNALETTMSIRVIAAGDQAEIQIDLDGKPAIRWKGAQKALSPYDRCQLADMKTFGLGAYSSNPVFKSVRLKMVSGTARLLRP